MYLKRLTISGFKSFATKTVLALEPGIMAVVGPNGAGKSNIVDAVRWVLGEQTGKSLRTKKGEEVIFAGTDKRPKASVAEVSLLLDNTSGHLALDFSEVEISRRLYRSGESEYRINGSKVNLRDIQHLLIQAGFGPNSYSVIGQGMIDSLILASPAERKLMFDEASGIREFELKREQALRKLEATDTNLVRVHDILGELEPRLATLQRGAEAAEARQGLMQELIQKHALYLAVASNEYEHQMKSAQAAIKLLTAQTKLTSEHIAQLTARKVAMSRPVQPVTQLNELHEYEAKRDNLSNELSVKRAEFQFLLEKKAELEQVLNSAGETDQTLTSSVRTRRQLARQLAEAQVEEAEATERMAINTKSIDKMQAKLAALRHQSDQTSRQEYVSHALTILKQVSFSLGNGGMTTEEIRLLVYKAGRLLSHASRGQDDILNGIRQAQIELTLAMKQREDAHEPYTTAVIKVRSLELDLANIEDQVAKLSEQLESTKRCKADLKAAAQQVAQREQQLKVLTKELELTNTRVQELRQQAGEQTNVRNDTDEIFQLAAELELAKIQHEESVRQIAQEQSALESAVHGLTEVGELRQVWFGSRPVPRVEAQGVRDEIKRELELLEARLQDTGAADAEVLEEFNEASQRYQFLNGQVTDLSAAQGDLQKVVAELDKLIKLKFEAAFTDMGRHFDTYFKQLFGGGKASLTLVPDATGTYGIDIKALPPSKRVESLATLSGGERALTGTALLAAILTVSPSPFVVLDEIDAALDEANSTRLSQILLDLTKHSQLIVITHNRQIMMAAQALYGVTMDAHHASKVLSVRLEVASQLAARQ